MKNAALSRQGERTATRWPYYQNLTWEVRRVRVRLSRRFRWRSQKQRGRRCPRLRLLCEVQCKSGKEWQSSVTQEKVHFSLCFGKNCRRAECPPRPPTAQSTYPTGPDLIHRQKRSAAPTRVTVRRSRGFGSGCESGLLPQGSYRG